MSTVKLVNTALLALRHHNHARKALTMIRPDNQLVRFAPPDFIVKRKQLSHRCALQELTTMKWALQNVQNALSAPTVLKVLVLQFALLEPITLKKELNNVKSVPKAAIALKGLFSL